MEIVGDVQLFDHMRQPLSSIHVMTFYRGRDVMTHRYLIVRGQTYFLEVPKGHYDPLHFEYVGTQEEETYTQISRSGDNSIQTIVNEGDEANFYGPCDKLSLTFLTDPMPVTAGSQDYNLLVVGQGCLELTPII